MKPIRWMAAVVLFALPAGAQAMDVRTFLAKTNALKAKGIFAMGSPDIDLLKGEMTSVMRDYRADTAAAQKAGKPLACPPQGAKMSPGELLTGLEAIPPAQRGMSVKAAVYQIARKRWPCPSR